MSVDFRVAGSFRKSQVKPVRDLVVLSEQYKACGRGWRNVHYQDRLGDGILLERNFEDRLRRANERKYVWDTTVGFKEKDRR